MHEGFQNSERKIGGFWLGGLQGAAAEAVHAAAAATALWRRAVVAAAAGDELAGIDGSNSRCAWAEQMLCRTAAAETAQAGAAAATAAVLAWRRGGSVGCGAARGAQKKYSAKPQICGWAGRRRGRAGAARRSARRSA
eukprot:CAMPEP_0206227484 /NCGR_PEP_ID=MMETSP0047_2-20121206/8649_1 /ASSEMBLY_ACC=CAM_ASM_000192 /TAXON_ID=195065 /ORGANISM="Chroomonas mesostigmatica_cf, Strain CCMP1168" /LENGTH=137 /DNA_ID=CAMNT_0053650641 /DNA_START=1237 /DNA_END=1651 /DNA_ORIENTATION=+